MSKHNVKRPGYNQSNADRHLAAEIKRAHKRGFQEGAQATTLTAYLAIKDYGLPGIQWLSDRMSAAVAGEKKPPLSNYAIDKMVTRSVIESMKRYSPTRAAEVESAFADFLAGGTTK